MKEAAKHELNYDMIDYVEEIDEVSGDESLCSTYIWCNKHKEYEWHWVWLPSDYAKTVIA